MKELGRKKGGGGDCERLKSMSVFYSVGVDWRWNSRGIKSDQKRNNVPWMTLARVGPLGLWYDQRKSIQPRIRRSTANRSCRNEEPRATVGYRLAKSTVKVHRMGFHSGCLSWLNLFFFLMRTSLHPSTRPRCTWVVALNSKSAEQLRASFVN